MSNITTNVRTHVVTIKWDQEFHLTRPQYEFLRSEYDQAVETHKTARMVDITDIDSHETVWSGKLSSIESFKEKRMNKSPKRWYCDVGRLHGLSDECDCLDSSRINPNVFISRRMRLFPNVYYSQNLSESQRKEIIDNILTT